ncbi:hypothetical protein CDAR_590001 [Caerostris darwini]|uniref:Uncharacterized protein n=1 Tax=Caerostris darwini TaxID=1538125 RepID=A0AAV4SJW5_9ARAC|nr:hypothetical protein CDAR_590001 [Caerostris darwini]
MLSFKISGICPELHERCPVPKEGLFSVVKDRSIEFRKLDRAKKFKATIAEASTKILDVKKPVGQQQKIPKTQNRPIKLPISPGILREGFSR